MNSEREVTWSVNLILTGFRVIISVDIRHNCNKSKTKVENLAKFGISSGNDSNKSKLHP